MTFTGYSPASVLALLAAAAAMLFALHVLRSRPQRLRVVTTLFWRPARSSAQPRFLWHRFRYLATFLLLLGIVSLLAMAVSRLAWSFSALPARHTVLIIDAGMSMQGEPRGAKTRFDQAIAAAEKLASEMGARDRLAVVVADPYARVVHGFDRPIAVAGAALRQCAAASQPCDSAASMRLALNLLHGRTSPQIVRLTDRADASTVADSSVPVRTVVVGTPVANAAIVSAMFVPEPNQPHRGRLQARVGWWSAQPGSVPAVIRIDDQIAAQTVLQIVSGDTAEWVSPIIDARGQLARITLDIADAVASDNELTLRVPSRPEIVAAVDAALPDAIRVALEAAFIRTVSRGDRQANVTVRDLNEPASDLPEVVVVNDGPQLAMPAAVLVMADTFLARDISFEQARAGEGSAIPASGAETLISTGGQVLAAMDSIDVGRKRLLLGSALFGAGSNVPDHPGFVQFMARALHELGDWGRPARSIPPTRSIVDAAWAAEITLAGPLIVAPGDVIASDTFAGSSGAPADPVESPALPRQGRRPVPALLLLAALALVAIEAGLHVRGRII